MPWRRTVAKATLRASRADLLSSPRPGNNLNRAPRATETAYVSEDAEKEERSDGIRPALLPRLGDGLAALLQRFDVQPVLSVVVVDAPSVAGIESQSGHAAANAVMANLGALVRDVAETELADEPLVLAGEIGRHEVAVFLSSAPGQGRFYRRELPAFVAAIRQAIEKQAHRLVYPYSRKAPNVGVGFAAAQRNPFLGSETQIRTVLGEARESAALARGLQARRRRDDFFGVVLAGEISSVYEPIVDVATKTVFGYESLARGPAGTPYHTPLVLFETAEEEGLVFELDCLCRQSGLDGAIGLPEGTKLFLNVRPTTIHDPNFQPDALTRTLERTRLRPSDVVFEISEQESIENFDAFREIRDQYRNLGFQFAIDDTGSGYASLQSVIELEPDYVKVDRAFITGLDTDPAKQTLLKALQSVAAGIGSRMIGEGLDTLEELEMLGELGIEFGQGWLFGKPTPLRADE